MPPQAPLDPNTQFVQEVAAAAGGKGVIFACEAGGTMRPTVNFAQGKASRSLQVRRAAGCCVCGICTLGQSCVTMLRR